MAQFTVHRNPNPGTRATFPLLLDVQSDLVADLGTRLVAPLAPAAAMKGRLIETLIPVFEIEGKGYAMITLQLAGIGLRQLGEPVVSLSSRRQQILAALDLLLTGF